MLKILLGLAGLILGFVIGYVVSALALIVGGEMLGVSQFEGAYAMGVGFFWAPLFALVTGAACMVWGIRFADRKARAGRAQTIDSA